jgi:hypothetical protein
MIKGVEYLGGSGGYEKYLQNQNSSAAIKADSGDSDWSTCAATGVIAAALVVTAIDVYADGYTGSGWSWGLGDGVGGFAGGFSHAPWSKLTSKTNQFDIASATGTVITFSIDGSNVGDLYCAAIGALATAAFGGDLDWK